MNLLILSSIFPNARQPTQGMFVAQQLQELTELCRFTVIAPVPWAPALPLVRKWRTASGISPEETFAGAEVFHPRYLVTPKIGRSLYGFFYFQGIWPTVRRLHQRRRFDAIVGYFAFPDCFAAVMLGRRLNLPVISYVLGSDIKVFTRNWLRRSLTVWALNNSDRIISVSEDLAQAMRAIGVGARPLSVLTNGVDTARFAPRDRRECRKQLGISDERKVLLFIGTLRRIKGVEYLVAAAAGLAAAFPELQLCLVGDGALRNVIAQQVADAGLSGRVLMPGNVGHEQLPVWFNACDVFCLPSLSEGCPNVVLEALACGKPVVASAVGGIPELLNAPQYGILVPPADSPALEQALKTALNGVWDTERIRERVAGLSWKETAQRLLSITREAVQERTPSL